MNNKYILVDANNLFMHVFFSVPSDVSDNDIGKIATFGFFSQILNYSQYLKTNKIVYFFDSLKSYRKKVYPEYKSKRRDKTPEEKEKLKIAYKQIALIKEKLISLNENVFFQSGYESDDLIAKFCLYYYNYYKYIISSDNDLSQLINDKTVRCCMSKKRILTTNSFYKIYGYKPEYVALIKSYSGCSSDSVEGIKLPITKGKKQTGIGEKTALKYINGELKQTTKAYKAIVDNKAVISRNSRLVTLPYMYGRVPIKELIYKEISRDKDRFFEMFKELGIFNLANEDLDRWVNFLQS